MGQSNTQKKILDAAEHLFAKEGFHSTSLRMLTREAGVNLAAVNYHFGSKEELIKAVIERRLLPLNRLRIDKLHGVKELAEEFGDQVVIAKVDVDSNPGISFKFGIRNIPTILFFKDGEVADKQVGVVPKGVLADKLKALM